MPYVIQLADGSFAPKTRGQPNAKTLQNAGLWISKAAAIKQLDPRFWWEREHGAYPPAGLLKAVQDSGARVREVQLVFVDEN
jgi:hypothetical protein